MKKHVIIPFIIFITWVGAIFWWTGGLKHFTTYSHAMYRAGETPRKMPDLKMIDYNRKETSFDHFKGTGKYALIDFMYLHCSSVCGIVRSRLYDYKKDLAPWLAKNLTMISVSFDPARDTPEILKETWRSLGGEPNWIFASLQGSGEQIRDEMYKFGIVIIPRPNGDFNHTTMHYLVDPNGTLVAVIDPSQGKEKTLQEIKKYIGQTKL